ncbi:adenosylcobinamide-GDP ribazoletransferase [Carnimonas nigrificans]|uniref:adenosylcobinamide-GDP ribazoletransferase n=1 Tax=Carnimonas nigrificans TaxID=64323 RepID=UPI00046F075A|nr:adenosylcobinamide-GDP ribazoletransferase [Carnimonas nigrificans]
MSNVLARQLYLMRLALAFLTRIPVSVGAPSALDLQHSRRYFSLIGAGIGVISLLFYTVILWWLSPLIAAPLTIAITLIITGGFHEDGLADTVDGIGGGHTPEQRLAIMKDSRIGSFGALALIMALLIKTAALLTLSDHPGVLAGTLITAAAISRAAAVIMMALLPYARLHNSKVVALSDTPQLTELLLNIVVALIIAVIALGSWLTLVSALTIALMLWLLRSWFRRRLGGYSGDCLGMVQVVAELLIYLIVIAHVS